jgi:drug/metabolite transporter (DMT)-like permease
MLPLFKWPDGIELVHLAAAGILVGIGQFTMLAAARAVTAVRLAPVQYSQMAWAVGLGAIFYHEYPDLLMLAGIALIVVSGLFTLLREKQVSVTAGQSRMLRTPV